MIEEDIVDENIEDIPDCSSYNLRPHDSLTFKAQNHICLISNRPKCIYIYFYILCKQLYSERHTWFCKYFPSSWYIKAAWRSWQKKKKIFRFIESIKLSLLIYFPFLILVRTRRWNFLHFLWKGHFSDSSNSLEEPAWRSSHTAGTDCKIKT